MTLARPLAHPGTLFVLGCAAAAACVDFSRYHEGQHADALIPVMVSLYKWEPFYWGQSRLGMLLPTLALPFEHPFGNMLVQNGLSIFGAFAVSGCLTLYLVRDRRWPALGALGAILFLFAFPAVVRFDLMNGSQPYAIPLALATLAIVLVSKQSRGNPATTAADIAFLGAGWLRSSTSPLVGEVGPASGTGGGLYSRTTPHPLLTPFGSTSPTRREVERSAYPSLRGMGRGVGSVALRWAAALLLTGVSYWMHFGIGSQIAILAGGRFLYERAFTKGDNRGVRELAVAAGLTIFGSGVGAWLMSLSRYAPAEVGLTPAAQWVSGWRHLTAELACHSGVGMKVLGGAMIAGLFWWLLPATSAAAVRCWALFAVILVWLVLLLAIAGTLEWVKVNGFDLRYLYPGLLAVGPAAAVLALGPLLAARPLWLPAATAVLCALLPVCAVVSYGVPSVGAAHEGLDRAAGRHTQDLLDAGCTHVVGEYWPAWAATFHANLTLYERGDPRRVWPVAYRGDELWAEWRDDSPYRMKLGCVGFDGRPPERPPPLQWAWAFIDIVEVERRGTIVVYKVK